MTRTEAAWPVIVGGEYEFRTEDKVFLIRVTAIYEEEIFAVHKRRDTGAEFGPISFSPNHFRAMFIPEDQSPISALIETLKAAYNFIANSKQPQAEWAEAVKVSIRETLERAGAL